jgi:N-methylhydantoinase B/oxoprolinase/acetone carboxylase alpha subunit
MLTYRSIGGLHGNSMPPESEELWQEGALIHSAFLVRDGVFNEAEMIRYLTEPGQYPDCKAAARVCHSSVLPDGSPRTISATFKLKSPHVL